MNHVKKALMALGTFAVAATTLTGLGASPASAVCARQAIDPAPYISVGTNVEQYYNICQVAGVTTTFKIQRRVALTPVNVKTISYTRAVPTEIPAKLSANCDGTGTRTYRGSFTSSGSITTRTVNNAWKELYC